MEPDDDLEAVGHDEAALEEGMQISFSGRGLFAQGQPGTLRAASSSALRSCTSILVCVVLEEMLGERKGRRYSLEDREDIKVEMYIREN